MHRYSHCDRDTPAAAAGEDDAIEFPDVAQATFEHVSGQQRGDRDAGHADRVTETGIVERIEDACETFFGELTGDE